ncbi:phosphoribosylformylglycinamidine synthase domain-containing protein [Streptococcus pneumoniae]|nr:phosphoribosylformylglycinamidine synthase domain-containing protein [Streptococcus pneumoniae]
MSILKKKVNMFSVLLNVVLIAIIAIGVLFFLPKEHKSEVKSSINIESIEKVNEVVFLNAGINEIISETKTTQVLGFDVPFSKKAALVILNYKAKFGIKSSVKVEQISEKEYKVIVPKLEVIGVELSKDNPYDLYDSHGELLSGTTEDIDTGKLVANQLSSDKQAEYLDKFKSEIKESAINYYKTIFSSMDSEVKVTIEFTE